MSRRIFDCFMFSNELELLDLRLHELGDVVDVFVLVESDTTFKGDRKPLVFHENRERFAPWLHKIRHIVVDDLPSGFNPWTRERHQRNSILRGLTDCRPNDVVTITDADEIPRGADLANYDPANGVRRLELAMHYYYLNYRNGWWDKTMIAPYARVAAASPERIRMSEPDGTIPAAGWHWSYLGGVDRIVSKIESFSHQEFNTPQVKDRDRIAGVLSRGDDLFGRKHLGSFQAVPIDSSYPAYLRANLKRFDAAGMIGPNITRESQRLAS